MFLFIIGKQGSDSIFLLKCGVRINLVPVKKRGLFTFQDQSKTKKCFFFLKGMKMWTIMIFLEYDFI